MRKIIVSSNKFVNLHIRPFQSTDQAAGQTLILAGLAERWGTLDPALNPDLEDIYSSYVLRGNLFVVAEENGQIVGTGGLVQEEPGVGRIVRVSVSTQWRGRGLGRTISQRLIAAGQQRGYHTLLVETNDDWHSAIGLYQGIGFVPYARRNGELHMRLFLEQAG